MNVIPNAVPDPELAEKSSSRNNSQVDVRSITSAVSTDSRRSAVQQPRTTQIEVEREADKNHDENYESSDHSSDRTDTPQKLGDDEADQPDSISTDGDRTLHQNTLSHHSTASFLHTEAERLNTVLSDLKLFFQSTTSLVEDEFGRLYKADLKEYSSHIDYFRSAVKTVVVACQLWQSLTTMAAPNMRRLQAASRDMNQFIERKIKDEDLLAWLDSAPSAEEDKMRLAEERRAAEKVKMARSAEARAEVARIAVLLTEAEKSAAEATVDFQTATDDSKRAAEDAELALKTAIEAQIAAEEKKKAEEESKRLAEERKRKKAEEARLRREEEERRLAELASEKGTSLADEKLAFEERKRREELERRNPKNWPRHIYSVDPGEFDPGIGCIIRAFPGTMERDDVTVTRVDSLANVAALEENEELISNVICITEVYPDHHIAPEEPLSIAIPHCAPRGNPSREPAIKVIGTNGRWNEVETADVMFDDIREFRFVEARVKHVGVFMVVLRPKRDHFCLGKRGGKLTSSTEPRLTITARPGAFRFNNNFTLEVHPIDAAMLADLRLHHPADCSELLSCSPVVRMSSANQKFPKPMSMTVPLPASTHRHKQRPSTAISRDRPEISDKRPSTAKPALTTPSIFTPRTEESGTPDENLCMLVKRNSESPWEARRDVTLVHQKNKDIVAFNLTEMFDRFVIISTKSDLPDLQTEKIPDLLETNMRQKKVTFVLRQSNDNPGEVIVACTLANKSDRLLHDLSEEGYDEGPSPTKPLTVTEGQIMELRFRGNIRCKDGKDCIKFVYNSRIPCRMDMVVEEIDTFAQKSFDSYRGFAQVFTSPVDSAAEERTDIAQAQRHLPSEQTRVLLRELLISLPKPHSEPPKPLQVAPVSLKTEGAVDEDILRRISEDMGDEWKRLAQCLNVRKMRVQAILRQNHNNHISQSAYDMLLTWAKRMPRFVNKVEVLASALLAVGRADLAEDIRGKDYDIRQQRAQSARDFHLRRVFVKVAQDVRVAKAWKMVAMQIGLTNEEIEEVDGSEETAPERCLCSLKMWQKKMGIKATTTALVKHLRMCRFTQTARQFNLRGASQGMEAPLLDRRCAG